VTGLDPAASSSRLAPNVSSTQPALIVTDRVNLAVAREPEADRPVLVLHLKLDFTSR
jgi:hypothetical protein